MDLVTVVVVLAICELVDFVTTVVVLAICVELGAEFTKADLLDVVDCPGCDEVFMLFVIVSAPTLGPFETTPFTLSPNAMFHTFAAFCPASPEYALNAFQQICCASGDARQAFSSWRRMQIYASIVAMSTELLCGKRC